MPRGSTSYALESGEECDRLERQAALLDFDRLLRGVRPRAGAVVLDAGCGSGATARQIARRHPNATVTAVDSNPAFLEYAQARAASEGLANLTFEQADVQALPFADASFDSVWSQFVLYFLPQPQRAIAEAKRVLRPGGRVVFALHEDSWLINEPKNAKLQARLETVALQIADLRIARRVPLMMRDAGFAEVAVEVELDPVYTAIGRMREGPRRNAAEIWNTVMPRIVEILGSQSAADTFVADSLAWLDDPNTCSYSFLWLVSGSKPEA
jgi:ubiquinone/menaquinone biosynthesis C-methylase UbiE